jgi:hypothetical protein
MRGEKREVSGVGRVATGERRGIGEGMSVPPGRIILSASRLRMPKICLMIAVIFMLP